MNQSEKVMPDYSVTATVLKQNRILYWGEAPVLLRLTALVRPAHSELTR